MARLKDVKQAKLARNSKQQKAAAAQLKATKKSKYAKKFKLLKERYPKALKALLVALKNDTPCPLIVKDAANESKRLKKKSVRKLTFMDLPPEIRLIVYEYALTAAGPIRFKVQKDHAALEAALRHWNQKRGNRSRIVGYPRPRIMYRLVVEPVKEHGVRKISRKFGETHAAGLLRANRTIHNESWPVLYAQNRFLFRDALALDQFYDMTKSAFPMLSDVEVRKVYPHHDRDIIAPVLESRKLRRLSLKLRRENFSSNKLARLLAIILSRPASMRKHKIICASLEHEICDCFTQAQRDCRIDALEVTTPSRIDFRDGRGRVDLEGRENQERLKTEIKSWLDGPVEALRLIKGKLR